MQTYDEVVTHWIDLARGVAVKLPWATATVGFLEWAQVVHFLPGATAAIEHAAFFSTVFLAIVLDTYFGVRASCAGDVEEFKVSALMSGVGRKMFEYWGVLYVAVAASAAVEGDGFWSELMGFVVRALWVGILYAEADSAMKNADLRIQHVWEAVIEKAVKRFGNGK